MGDAGDVAPVRLAVVGAHLSGEPLNHQLTSRGARPVATTTTAPVYRLVALATVPPKPGMIRLDRDEPAAGAIEVEVWELDAAGFGSFVDEVPAPLCIGRVLLADGTDVAGFLCEPLAAEGARDITAFGGWRAFRASG
jgi:allophanate hydrolase